MITLRFGIYLSILLTGAIAGFIHYRKLEPEFKIITILLLITLISESITRVLAVTIRNTSPVYHFYSPIEYIGWALAFYYLAISFTLKRLILFSIVVFVILSVLNSLFLQTWLMLNSNADLMKTLLTSTFSFFVLLEQIKQSAKSRKLLNAHIILILAVLWFNLQSFFFFAFHNYFLSKKVKMLYMYDIHYVSNIIYYILIVVAIVKSAKSHGRTSLQ
jgi:hypothetical protein